jgi:hypothetical protein
MPSGASPLPFKGETGWGIGFGGSQEFHPFCRRQAPIPTPALPLKGRESTFMRKALRMESHLPTGRRPLPALRIHDHKCRVRRVPPPVARCVNPMFAPAPAGYSLATNLAPLGKVRIPSPLATALPPPLFSARTQYWCYITPKCTKMGRPNQAKGKPKTKLPMKTACGTILGRLVAMAPFLLVAIAPFCRTHGRNAARYPFHALL